MMTLSLGPWNDGVELGAMCHTIWNNDDELGAMCHTMCHTIWNNDDELGAMRHTIWNNDDVELGAMVCDSD